MDDATYFKLMEENPDEFHVGIFTVKREVLYEMLLDGDKPPNEAVLVISMPCGHKYQFMTRDSLPNNTMMCRCGNKKHVVIKYADVVERQTH